MAALQDRVVIVTGGGHGIGRAYCHGLAREGAKVVATDIDGAAAERVVEEVRREGGEGTAVAMDVADEGDAQRMAEVTMRRYGRIDALVNNAAVFISVPLLRVNSIEEMTVAEWDRVMSVNVRGVFLCCRAVVPQMKAQNYGKIVNIASTTALQGISGFGPYPVSKAAVMGISRTLARDLGAYNITVNSVAPGGTLSLDEATEAEVTQAEANLTSTTRLTGIRVRAIRRVETPADLVGAVVFLCSPASDFISGQTLVVDGGSYMT